MSSLSETSASGPGGKNLPVVMVLSHPPSPWRAPDWYWNPVAGIPLLLRNILTVQRGGVERLILLGENDLTSLDELCQRAASDSRVRLQLECLADSKKLTQTVDASQGVLFLDGSSLYNKTIIAETLGQASPGTQSEIFRVLPLDREETDSFLRQIGATGLSSWLEENLQRQESPVATGASFNSHRHSRFLTAARTLRITKEEDFRSLEEQLIQTCGLSNDSFMDQFVTRHISRQLTRRLIKTSLTPNQITLISLAVGLGSAACFLPGSYGTGIIGAGLLLLSAWIDCTDGEVARLKFLESPFGKKLDIYCDNVVHLAAFFSMGLGLYLSTNKIIFIYLGLLAVLGSLVSFLILGPEIVSQKTQAAESTPPAAQAKKLSDKLANRDFTYFLFFMALIGRLDLFLSLTAAGANIFAGFLLYKKFKPQAATARGA